MQAIESFTGKYRWMSNFHPVDIPFEGRTYMSVEAAYVAAKTLDETERKFIHSLPTSGKCKAFGRNGITLRYDWDHIKLGVMEQLLREKFKERTDLATRLIETGDCEIIEGNWWGDTFWGVCKGKGENHLGRLIMKIRSELQQKINEK